MTPEEKITYSKVRLLVRHRLFGALLLEFPMKECHPKTCRCRVRTLCTDNVNIYWHREFVDKFSKNQITTLVLHELKHILYKHFMRFKLKDIRTQEEMELVNFALDYAINSIIINEMAPKDNLLEFPKGILYDEKFKGMDAEKILLLLKEERKKNKAKSQQRIQSACAGGNFGQFDDHWSSSQMTQDTISKNKKNSGKSTQDQMNDIDKKIFKAASTLSSKERGELPDDLQRMIDDYLDQLEGHVDWRRYIKHKVQEVGRGQYTTSKFNRQYLQYGIYLPGQIGSKAKIAMAVDTSGSISNEELVEFIGELKHMLKLMPFLEVILYGCDADVHGKAKIKGMRNFREGLTKTLKGGGGTSFIPVFKDLMKGKDKDIKVLFYFTDGYGDQDEIEKKCGKGTWLTFWVVPVSSKKIDFPFGKKIVMYKDKQSGEDE